MLFLNGNEITYKYFADGAIDIKIAPELLKPEERNEIRWLFDNNEELVIVYYLVKHMNTKGIDDIVLKMPYIPNARKDRAERPQDVFTLKYFAELINSLHFKYVEVLDPHSVVSTALIDRIRPAGPEKNVAALLGTLGENVLLYYPDEGSVKRYAEKIGREYIYGMKSRDKTTRVINHLEICGETEKIKDSDILMVDDICASGKTLLISARKLRELGAGRIFVYVSHCEETVLGGELLDEIDALYTTDSIFRSSHPKIRLI
ncbi:MAG: ribose-phosphate pyrophosphokinase [Lachnospiraceae bacterium]|nr:ribose-phosphate pyrophosphokinase [Lachnospiraceae bacterium]